MSVKVMLNVYSGLPNPSWELSSEESDAFVGQVGELRRATNSKPSAGLGGLGYRGLLVERSQSAPEGPLNLYVHEGIVDRGQAETNLLDDNQVVERYLL